MVRLDSGYVFCAVLALSSLAGCSSREEAAKAPPVEVQREFGEEAKRTARALSISQGRAVADSDSPYARALLCRNGMEALVGHFRDAQALSEQQRQGMEQARVYFDKQLQLIGEREGKSISDIGSDLEQTAQDNPDIAENARIALGCLQRLQEMS